MTCDLRANETQLDEFTPIGTMSLFANDSNGGPLYIEIEVPEASALAIFGLWFAPLVARRHIACALHRDTSRLKNRKTASLLFASVPRIGSGPVPWFLATAAE